MLNLICLNALVWVNKKSKNLWPTNGMLAILFVAFEVLHDSLSTPISPFSLSGMKQVHLFFGLFTISGKESDVEICLFIGCVMLLSLVAVAWFCNYLNWPRCSEHVSLTTVLFPALLAWWVYDLLYWAPAFQSGVLMYCPALFGVCFTLLFLTFRIPVFSIVIGPLYFFFTILSQDSGRKELEDREVKNREDSFLGAVNDDDSTFF